MRVIEQGWLRQRPEITEINGIPIPIETRTRREEYRRALDSAPLVPGRLLDMATGFMPEWHRFAEIMGLAGWSVEACDRHPEVMTLGQHPNVTYHRLDATAVPWADGEFDYVTCISTLEHLEEWEQDLIASEMLRVVRPTGRLFVSADMAPGLPVLFGGSPASMPPPNDSVQPPVYYVVVEP